MSKLQPSKFFSFLTTNFTKYGIMPKCRALINHFHLHHHQHHHQHHHHHHHHNHHHPRCLSPFFDTFDQFCCLKVPHSNLQGTVDWARLLLIRIYRTVYCSGFRLPVWLVSCRVIMIMIMIMMIIIIMIIIIGRKST